RAAWPSALGAFVVSDLLMSVVGLMPALGALALRIPSAIAAAMLAGVLLPFCLNLFRLGSTEPLLIVVLVATFVIARQAAPLYALLLVLAGGVILRSEEHTSELQSRENLVCRLLLEKSNAESTGA